jgi:hypothetical protein
VSDEHPVSDDENPVSDDEARVTQSETGASNDETGASSESGEELDVEDGTACRGEGEMPQPGGVPPSSSMLEIFERDGWECTVPGCSARSMLHDHHLTFRSKFGKKTQEICHDLSNRTTVCWFHHRQVHRGIIKVSDKAPLGLKWQMPKLLEAAVARSQQRVRAGGAEEESRRHEEYKGRGPVPYQDVDTAESRPQEKEGPNPLQALQWKSKADAPGSRDPETGTETTEEAGRVTKKVFIAQELGLAR